ncbi:hypothetical protein [Streptomyces pilosus]|uniref:Secreted protein n=1 Tax=Streptomyces pilosus TaxID=28893 RepID=A0A918C3D5_9ACTN|nr:hypothetical protein [Streptomyces pilosus]GGR02675.1 hypothetical protein GCM10010280_58450 [Streptomyces pilosus]
MSGTEKRTPEPATTGKRTARRTRAAAVAGSVLLAGAVVATGGYTVVTVQNADRDAGTPRWGTPSAAAAEGTAAETRGPAAMLVPYGHDGWLRGPDLAEFGSDTRLGGAAAVELLKKASGDLPRAQRDRWEKEIDSHRVEETAMRSYFSGSLSVYSESEISTVSIVLTRMKDRDSARDLATSRTELLGAADTSREGPAVEGHDSATCFVASGNRASRLASMRCTAHAADVLVTLTADGGKPLDTRSVAVLLGQQLDRIHEPGKAA